MAGFEVMKRGWVVERMCAWISRNHRMSKDYEFLAETTEALIYIVMIPVDARKAGKRSDVKPSQTPFSTQTLMGWPEVPGGPEVLHIIYKIVQDGCSQIESIGQDRRSNVRFGGV